MSFLSDVIFSHLCPTHFQDLAFDYDMVLTTFNRLSAEYGNGFDRAMGGTGVRPTGNRQVPN